ncbi:hypothetical protein BJV78DRAFT_1220219, partial [Lactifluus subvellereus]
MTRAQATSGVWTLQHCGHQTPLSECGCLSDAVGYRAVLELFLRLRRAAEVLSRHPVHHVSSTCFLKQRIMELDVFPRFVAHRLRMFFIKIAFHHDYSCEGWHAWN